jgi:hypothetical protein
METHNPNNMTGETTGLPGMGPAQPAAPSDAPQAPMGVMGMAPAPETASVGGGTLLFMRSAGSLENAVDARQVAAEKKIDQALRRIGPNGAAMTSDEVKRLFDETESIIALFAEDPSDKQVKLGELKKNPFERVAPADEKVAAFELDRNAAELAAQRELEARQKMREEALKELQLQSLVSGSNPAAFISGQLVRPGDRIGPFKVETIDNNSVLIAAEGSTYTLTLSGPGQFKR